MDSSVSETHGAQEGTDSAHTAGPANSITCPTAPAAPISAMTARIRSLAETCGPSRPSMPIRIRRGRRRHRVCVARTCATSEAPMPKASAPCVAVCESPQTRVRPGRVIPCSGPTTCTMPWVHDALARIVHPHHVEAAPRRVGRQARDQPGGLGVGDRQAPRVARHVMIGDAEGEARPPPPPSGVVEHGESMEAALVHQVAVDPQQGGAVRAGQDRVRVPDLVEQGAAGGGEGRGHSAASQSSISRRAMESPRGSTKSCAAGSAISARENQRTSISSSVSTTMSSLSPSP